MEEEATVEGRLTEAQSSLVDQILSLTTDLDLLTSDLGDLLSCSDMDLVVGIGGKGFGGGYGVDSLLDCVGLDLVMIFMMSSDDLDEWWVMMSSDDLHDVLQDDFLFFKAIFMFILFFLKPIPSYRGP